MIVSRHAPLALLALSLACSSRTVTPIASSGGSESGGSETSAGSSNEASSESETGDPGTPCATEWDCGIGERCIEGTCDCVGCSCKSPNIAPGTIAAPDEENNDEIPVSLDLPPAPEPECDDAADCGALETCMDGWCVETTTCVEDLDCYAAWWAEYDWFCVDSLCQPLACDYASEGDAGCPGGSVCEWDEGCKWLGVKEDCPFVPPPFEELMVHMLDPLVPTSVVVLDVDLDGRDDIVVLEDGFIYWLTSIGVGFGPPTPWPVEPGTQFVDIARGDVHADGVDELMVLQADPIGVEFLAAGPGWPQWVGFAETMAAPEGAIMMDVDFDGLPDLVTGTLIDGPMTLVEAQLGDGTGTFGSLWTEAVDPFVFSQPLPHADESECTRHLGALEPLELAIQDIDAEGVTAGKRLVAHGVAGHTIYPENPEQHYSPGFFATAALVDRGVLFLEKLAGPPMEIAPSPGPIALVSTKENSQSAIIDHGVEMAEFVRLGGNPLQPLCRGTLDFALDAVALDVGDFDGDGRQDLLGQGPDGLLRAWFSRD